MPKRKLANGRAGEDARRAFGSPSVLTVSSGGLEKAWRCRDPSVPGVRWPAESSSLAAPRTAGCRRLVPESKAWLAGCAASATDPWPCTVRVQQTGRIHGRSRHESKTHAARNGANRERFVGMRCMVTSYCVGLYLYDRLIKRLNNAYYY